MSERRKYLTITGLLGLAVVIVGLLAIPGSPIQKKPTLGLDLQGGLEVVLKAVPPENKPGYEIQPSDIDRSVTIMRNRIDRLGVSEPEIRKQGNDQIVIQLAGVKDPRQAAELIGKTAQLQFYDLEADIAFPSKSSSGQIVPKNGLFPLLSPIQAQVNAKSSHWYLFDNKKRLFAGPEKSRAALLDLRKVKRLKAKKPASARGGAKGGGGSTSNLPKGYKIFAVPSNRIVITCGTDAVVCPGVGAPTRTYYYLFKYDPTNKSKPIPEMTGEDLKLSGTRADFDTQTSEPIVLMQFTGDGGKKFADITAQEATRGKLAYSASGNQGDPRNYFQSFAIVLDNEIRSFPTIDFTQYPNGISGSNGAQITGLNGISEAKQLALVLQTGALPVRFEKKADTIVSATLGKDSLNQAKTAALIGLLVVALFLLIFYRFLGLVAVIGLAIYAAFMYAAILLFHVTLTLPGFAGMILTIGVAADANVVIFERIKEEVRSGKSVRHAIATGYSKGFHTIIDANVVTAITALVLFAVATAQVKGFALMLLIGTVISLVTAVAATRALLGLLAGFRWFDNPRFMGAAAAQRAKWLELDFMGKRYLWLAISSVAVLVSVVALGVKGLNLGIDFEGGTQTTFTTPRPVSLGDVRDQAATIGQRSAVVQGQGKQFGEDSYRRFQVRTHALKAKGKQEAQFTNGLRSRFDANILGSTNVSSSFGRQIARSAILAVIVSLLLIILYITIRFQFKFAGPVIVALIHDIALTVGVYALTGREVTTATVAAVLTVLGYSIYDTIIIFDRIRENIPLMRRASFATIANVSLWETIRRSLATSFITLLPVTALLLFGGATLKDFAFALIVGIASGAYSSIFIAAPLLTMWKEREPEYARRRERVAVGKTVGMVGVAATEETAPEVEAAPAVLEEEPEPELVPTGSSADPAKAEERRRRRQQRRRTRPHGRAR